MTNNTPRRIVQDINGVICQINFNADGFMNACFSDKRGFRSVTERMEKLRAACEAAVAEELASD